ncbi:hypothetical protein MRB53_010437 [Persea americana]|uniref:Uncharacterized protein n=1 Tax=Persea americana TaxID=3435 RepID=A0ACC2LS60_PERAE|nr:hypothetical protein MRB53_010437 [Persea americana]
MDWEHRESTYEDLAGLDSLLYDEGDGYHTIRMHYGVTVDHFDFCHSDKMSTLELFAMVEELGIGKDEVISFQYKLQDHGWKKIISDVDALEMVLFVDSSRVIDLYVKENSVDVNIQSQMIPVLRMMMPEVEFTGIRNEGEQGTGEGQSEATSKDNIEEALQNPSRRELFLEDEHDDVDKENRLSRPNEEELTSSDEEKLEDEFAHMALGRCRQFSADTQVLVPDRIASQHEIDAGQPDLSSLSTTGSSVSSSSRRVRGRVVGHESEMRMRILGSRIYVPLGAQSGAFEGTNASTFAIEQRSHIRRLVPLYKETWGAIDAKEKYDFSELKTDAHVAVAVGRLAMHIYREFRAELHRAYKKLLEKGHDPKQCPYDMQRTAQ